MGKAFSTVRLLRGKEPLLRRMLCEVRFRDGQLYLDHTGRLLKKLVRDGAWTITPEPTTKGTAVFHLVEGLQLSFSIYSASLDLDRTNGDDLIDTDQAARFVQRAEETLGFVLDELEVTDIDRLGFRLWYYFPCVGQDDAQQWLRDLGIVTVSANLLGAFEAAPDSMGLSFVLKGQDCYYRIGLDGIERVAQLPMGETTLNIRTSGVSKGQKAALLEAMKQKRQRVINSAFAAVLDIDTYRNDPAELGLAQFLNDCLAANLDRFRNAIPSENGKKGK